MTRTSQRVRDLYKKYPYPPREPGTSLDPYIDYILSFSAETSSHQPSFLDAGCGTGNCVLGAALLDRGLQVYGCDFNPEGLAQIQEDVEELGLTNVTLREVDLMDFPKDFGPSRGFDVIYCTGVIHHTPDPLAVLKKLATRLAPQGVLRLMVYAERGRADLYRFADVVKSLVAPEDSLDKKLVVAKELMNELAKVTSDNPAPSLRGPFENSHHTSLEEFADRYLHPHDIPYNLATLQEHIEASGLNFLGWFESRSWDLQELLPELFARGDFPEDPWERFEIVEELFDRDQYDLYLVRPEFRQRSLEFHWDLPVRLNPQVHLTESSFRGMGYQYSVKLLFEPEERLQLHQARVAKALSNRTASLRQLLEEWNQPESAEWFQAGFYLFSRDLIYSPAA